MGMLALLPSSREIDTMTHPNFSALTALQCIPASLRAHAVAQVLKYWHLSFACTKETCLVSVAVTLFSCFRRHPFLHSVFTYCTRQVHQLFTLVPQMPQTEITETDFKPNSVRLSHIVLFCAFDIQRSPDMADVDVNIGHVAGKFQ